MQDIGLAKAARKWVSDASVPDLATLPGARASRASMPGRRWLHGSRHNNGSGRVMWNIAAWRMSRLRSCAPTWTARQATGEGAYSSSAHESGRHAVATTRGCAISSSRETHYSRGPLRLRGAFLAPRPHWPHLTAIACPSRAGNNSRTSLRHYLAQRWGALR